MQRLRPLLLVSTVFAVLLLALPAMAQDTYPPSGDQGTTCGDDADAVVADDGTITCVLDDKVTNPDTTPPRGDSGTASAGDSGTASAGGSGVLSGSALANTGASATTLGLVAATLLTLGLMLLTVRRRRTTH